MPTARDIDVKSAFYSISIQGVIENQWSHLKLIKMPWVIG
jgi:hypothetical protein